VLRAEAAVGAPTGGHPAAVLRGPERDPDRRAAGPSGDREVPLVTRAGCDEDAEGSEREREGGAQLISFPVYRSKFSKEGALGSGGFGLVRFPP
jgi:hypothetical protein